MKNIEAKTRKEYEAMQYAGMTTAEIIAAKEAQIEECKKNIEILEELEIDLRDIVNRHNKTINKLYDDYSCDIWNSDASEAIDECSAEADDIERRTRSLYEEIYALENEIQEMTEQDAGKGRYHD